MERILQNAPFTASMTFYEDGVAVDPATVTIGVTRDDGTVLIAPGTSTAGSGTAPRTFNLTAANTAQLDTLLLTWTSTTKGVRTSVLQVAGGFLFPLSALRARFPDTTAYPVADLVTARQYAEETLEDACNLAFVPRYGSWSFIGSGRWEPLVFPRNDVRLIRSALNNGVALTSQQLANLMIDRGVAISGQVGTGWAFVWSWNTPCVIRYEFGRDYPSADESLAALDIATDVLPKIQAAQASGVDPRAVEVITQDGTVRFDIGDDVARFGIPSVDRVVRAHQGALVA